MQRQSSRKNPLIAAAAQERERRGAGWARCRSPQDLRRNAAASGQLAPICPHV